MSSDGKYNCGSGYCFLTAFDATNTSPHDPPRLFCFVWQKGPVLVIVPGADTCEEDLRCLPLVMKRVRNKALADLARAHDVDKLQATWKGLEELACKPDECSYCILLGALMEHGHYAAALKYLLEMQASRMTPRLVGGVRFLSPVAVCGLLEYMLSIYRLPDDAMFVAAIESLAMSAHRDAAEDIRAIGRVLDVVVALKPMVLPADLLRALRSLSTTLETAVKSTSSEKLLGTCWELPDKVSVCLAVRGMLLRGARELQLVEEEFKAWIARQTPFDVVLDAANIAYGGTQEFEWRRVEIVVGCFPDQRVLVVVHQRWLPLMLSSASFSASRCEYYVVGRGQGDDVYWLYAALYCDAYVVTNDLCRNHFLQKSWSLRVFARWFSRRHVGFAFAEEDNKTSVKLWWQYQMRPRSSCLVPGLVYAFPGLTKTGCEWVVVHV